MRIVGLGLRASHPADPHGPFRPIDVARLGSIRGRMIHATRCRGHIRIIPCAGAAMTIGARRRPASALARGHGPAQFLAVAKHAGGGEARLNEAVESPRLAGDRGVVGPQAHQPAFDLALVAELLDELPLQNAGRQRPGTTNEIIVAGRREDPERGDRRFALDAGLSFGVRSDCSPGVGAPLRPSRAF